MALKSETNKDSQVSSSKVLNPTCNIVIAPLNWGLGHATRSIPVIQFLLKNNINPIIASDGVSLELLRKEFPDLECVELTSYGVRYCKNGIFLRFKLLFQFPFLLYSAFREHRLLKGLVAHRKIDGVISDNRFGMFHKSIPSIYITHQIKVLSGATTFFSSWVHRMCIRNFDECWVPDSEGEQSLAGVLSSNCNLNMPLKYLGNLTRFSFTTSAYTYKYLLLLSGPEPQRT
ncbi:MAG: glycosyltransferase, partial [Flavicella sp.]